MEKINETTAKLPVLTIEQARQIEDLVLDAWEGRAKSLLYNPKHKSTIKLQVEFLMGMVVTMDILTNAAETKQSSVSPKVLLNIWRGNYITKENKID